MRVATVYDHTNGRYYTSNKRNGWLTMCRKLKNGNCIGSEQLYLDAGDFNRTDTNPKPRCNDYLYHNSEQWCLRG
jgi:hypothetical protein